MNSICKYGHDKTITGYTKRGLCKQCRVLENRRYRETHQDLRDEQRWKYSGITISKEEYKSLFNRQGGVCAICQKPESKIWKNKLVIKLAVDHCHKTGKVRGLLCHNCNTRVLKVVEDYPFLIEKAQNYLKGIIYV